MAAPSFLMALAPWPTLTTASTKAIGNKVFSTEEANSSGKTVTNTKESTRKDTSMDLVNSLTQIRAITKVGGNVEKCMAMVSWETKTANSKKKADGEKDSSRIDESSKIL